MFTFICAATADPSQQEFMLQLYETYQRLLFATAYRYCTDHYEVEEIVQESLLKLLEKIDRLQTLETRTLIAYMVATVRNTAFSYHRKKIREKNHRAVWTENAEERHQAPQLSMDELLIAAERRQELRTIWPEMPEEDRFLLEGKYFLDWSDSELAESLQCAPGTIRMKLTRARRRTLCRLLRMEEGYDREGTAAGANGGHPLHSADV